MSRTTAHTFITAALLLALSITFYLYGHHLAERQMPAAEGMFTLHQCFDGQFDSWEKAGSWLALVGISVSIGGVIFWAREMQPIVERASILTLDIRGPGPITSTAAPLMSVDVPQAVIDEDRAAPDEDESLSPLERVIRGY